MNLASYSNLETLLANGAVRSGKRPWARAGLPRVWMASDAEQTPQPFPDVRGPDISPTSLATTFRRLLPWPMRDCPVCNHLHKLSTRPAAGHKTTRLDEADRLKPLILPVAAKAVTR